MKMVLCSCLILAICSTSGCGLLLPGGKEAPKKAELALTYRDILSGDGDKTPCETKMKVFIDGELCGESEAADQYEKKTFNVVVEPGSHVLIVEGYTLKDGEWEKRTKAKGYSADHRLEKEIEISPGEQKVINFIVPDRAKDIKIQL